jgi:hypothetical protein
MTATQAAAAPACGAWFHSRNRDGNWQVSAFEAVQGSAGRNMRKELSDGADGRMAHSRK